MLLIEELAKSKEIVYLQLTFHIALKHQFEAQEIIA